MIKITLVVISTVITVYAQTPDTAWMRVYEVNSSEFANCVIETSDGGYVIAGNTVPRFSDRQAYLMKVDSDGDIVWTRSYGGSDEDGALDVKQTPDNGFIMVGFTSSFGAGDNDIYLIIFGKKENIEIR